jgi:hypothetical protein
MIAIPRTETVIIGKGMVASLLMAVMIKQTNKKAVTVRNYEGWEAVVSPQYLNPIPKTFPLEGAGKPTQYDKERAKKIEKVPKKVNLTEGAPALLTMPVIVRSVEDQAVVVLNAEDQFLTVLARHLHVLPAYFPFRVDRKQESIYVAPGSEFDWTCVCGNKDENRFYPCDIRGNEMSRGEGCGWDGLRACRDCGRVFHQDKLIILDQNTRPTFLYGDLPNEQ